MPLKYAEESKIANEGVKLSWVSFSGAWKVVVKMVDSIIVVWYYTYMEVDNNNVYRREKMRLVVTAPNSNVDIVEQKIQREVFTSAERVPGKVHPDTQTKLIFVSNVPYITKKAEWLLKKLETDKVIVINRMPESHV